MVGEPIKDGTGSGKSAKVNVDNRLLTDTVQMSTAAQASRLGDSYNINTGDITLTSAAESAVLYVKNNEDRDLIITTIIFLIGNSTNGSGDLIASVFANTTVGTVVDDASDVEMKHNKNFGSNQTLTADAYKGAQGKTLTDGTVAFRSRLNGASKQYSIGTGDIIIPKGGSIGVKITPQTGNTSVTLQVAMAVHLKNGNDE